MIFTEGSFMNCVTTRDTRVRGYIDLCECDIDPKYTETPHGANRENQSVTRDGIYVRHRRKSSRKQLHKPKGVALSKPCQNYVDVEGEKVATPLARRAGCGQSTQQAYVYVSPKKRCFGWEFYQIAPLLARSAAERRAEE